MSGKAGSKTCAKVTSFRRAKSAVRYSLRLRRISIYLDPIPLQGVPQCPVQLDGGFLPRRLRRDLGGLGLGQIALLLDDGEICGEARTKLLQLGAEKLLL